MQTTQPCNLIAVGITDPGSGRVGNQDAFLSDAEHGLFIVADGIGGHQGGAVAAKAVATGLPVLLAASPALSSATCKSRSSSTSQQTTRWLRDSIRELNSSVHSQGARQENLRGMGSTLACLLICNRTAYVAHMGDSRVYHWHGRRMTCLTGDHSLAALLVREGEISARAAVNHPGRGRLTRFIGMEQDVYPDICRVRLVADDWFVLCTDGLWSVLGDKRIGRILAQGKDPQQACASLVGAAKELHSQDNITCVVVKCCRAIERSTCVMEGR